VRFVYDSFAQGFGSVWRCQLGGFTVAMKAFYTGDSFAKNKHRVHNEITIIQKLFHPNIVSYLGHEIKGKELFLFMEYVPHSLHEIIRQIQDKKRDSFSIDEVVVCSLGILKALSYMHGLNEKIIHRDLKVRTHIPSLI
jgi:serine/threonine protein kinase